MYRIKVFVFEKGKKLIIKKYYNQNIKARPSLMRSKENTLFFLCFLSTVHEYLSQALPLTHQQVDPSFLFVKVLQILLSSVDDRCISSHQNFFGSTFFFFPHLRRPPDACLHF